MSECQYERCEYSGCSIGCLWLFAFILWFAFAIWTSNKIDEMQEQLIRIESRQIWSAEE